MVLWVNKWNIHPDKVEAYMEFVKGALPRVLAAPGLVEFRAYRPVTGTSQIVALYEFADMAAWATWYEHQDIQDIYGELRTLATDISTELWGPSPVVPEPIRPGT